MLPLLLLHRVPPPSVIMLSPPPCLQGVPQLPLQLYLLLYFSSVSCHFRLFQSICLAVTLLPPMSNLVSND